MLIEPKPTLDFDDENVNKAVATALAEACANDQLVLGPAITPRLEMAVLNK